MGVLVTLAVGGLLAVTAGSSGVSTDSAQGGRAPAAGPHNPASDLSAASVAPSDTRSAAADPPSVPVESLPTVDEAPPKPTANPVPAAATPLPARPAAARPSCLPPFVIDPATGKKKWKLECL
jgi:hypothetical protein